MELKASIIIIHFSNVNYTTDCVKSILKAKTNYSYEIVIIDNANREDDASLLKKKFKSKNNIHIYSNTSGNTGFSAGILTGLQYAKNDYMVILDNDTLVFDNWLDGLLNCFKNDKNVGISTAQILNPDSEKYTILGGKINLFGFTYSNLITLDDPSKSHDQNIFYGITAWCIKKSLLQKVHVDTNFQFFSDDADIGFKVKSLGYKVCPAIDAKVIHLKSKKDKAMNQDTVNFKVKICNRDYWAFTFIHLPLFHFFIFFIILVLFKICFLPLRIIRGDKSIPYDFIGFFAFLSMLGGLWKRREERQKLRKVSYISLLKQYSTKLYVGTMIFK